MEIKFFSNLVSGNFDVADKVSYKIKVNGQNNTFYNLPRYILKIKNNDFRGSLKIFKNQKLFFNVDGLNNLIKFWIRETENTKNYLSEKHFKKSTIHKLLILENFYNSEELIEIADLIYKKNNLNSHEFLLLAGFYFRVDNFEKAKEYLEKSYKYLPRGKSICLNVPDIMYEKIKTRWKPYSRREIYKIVKRTGGPSGKDRRGMEYIYCFDKKR